MTYKHIRSLSRGIEVLRYLNTVDGAHPSDICRSLDLPRPTVHRILETLGELTLIYQGPFSREFRVSPKVRELAQSRDQFGLIRHAAWPAMHALTSQVVWPSDIAVPQDHAMLIVESTHRISSMSADIGMIGQSRPMLVSPLGLAYLSHCGDAARDAILDDLYATATADDAFADRATIERALGDGRRDGFVICHDLAHRRCASMAVPVRVGGDVVACMNVVWHAAELTFDEARDQLGGPLMAARDRVEESLRDLIPGAAPGPGGGPGWARLAA
ncbi:helix-turn-helix domain-containing protein [Sphingomonas sp. 2SG]|jgi:IclR family mhp operon transcriptional activator|uniref:helix-turn-helix domain-containing protein n=1 Tax=Sphingomonas sp. 2SG TaxID=2502201 RepID=UPI0010F9EBE4|nr:helix-turn-helix domain-containing protein [Sphingomonas sp. 2SG]